MIKKSSKNFKILSLQRLFLHLPSENLKDVQFDYSSSTVWHLLKLLIEISNKIALYDFNSKCKVKH